MVVIVCLLLYCVAVFQPINLSRLGAVTLGMAAGWAAMLANVAGMVVGTTARAAAAPIVLLLAALAAKSAFALADQTPSQTDKERALSRAGMSLVAVACAEAIIIVIAGFVWALVRND
jgi:hypothetical protein